MLAYHNEAWAVLQACHKGGESQRRPRIGYFSQVYHACIFEGCSDELKEHFLEKTLSSLTCEEFQDIGSSFQEAHGRTQRSGRQSFTLLSSEESSTMNAWKVSAEDTVAKLEKVSV